MNKDIHKLVIQAEYSLTILPRILLIFSRRRIPVLSMHCQGQTSYQISIVFPAPLAQATLLQRQLLKQEEILDVEIADVPSGQYANA